jgi:hypothetical protein
MLGVVWLLRMTEVQSGGNCEVVYLHSFTNQFGEDTFSGSTGQNPVIEQPKRTLYLLRQDHRVSDFCLFFINVQISSI